jgi:hypothetical protein
MVFDANSHIVADPDRDARLLWTRIISRQS